MVKNIPTKTWLKRGLDFEMIDLNVLIPIYAEDIAVVVIATERDFICKV